MISTHFDFTTKHYMPINKVATKSAVILFFLIASSSVCFSQIKDTSNRYPESKEVLNLDSNFIVQEKHP